MFCLLLAISMKLVLVAALCNKGCLRCDSGENCILSDVFNNFTLKDSRAYQVNRPFCVKIDLYGICLECRNNFFIDNSTNSCVDVPKSKLQANCLLYSPEIVCIKCGNHTYNKGGKCLDIDKIIKGCLIYSSNLLCLECDSSYVTSFDRSACVTKPNIANCATVSFVQCERCKDGYLMNQNLYFDSLFGFGSSAEQFQTIQIMKKIIEFKLPIFTQRVCYAILDPYCREYMKEKKKCKSCTDGYYLNDDLVCTKNPFDTIYNCDVFQSLTDCSKCRDGYYITDGQCTKRKDSGEIPYCASYNASAPSVVCSECTISHYLLANRCVLRINSAPGMIHKCLSLNLLRDYCRSCESGYVLTSDKIGCNKEITNCKFYDITTFDKPLSCKICDSGYYISFGDDPSSTKVCLKGAIENCEYYQDYYPDACLRCTNSYIMKDGKCNIKHTVSDCDNFHPTILNKCLKCSTNTIKFTYGKVCKKVVNKIPNCISHIGTSVKTPICEKCADRFYLSGNKCLEIPLANCLTYDEGACINCDSNKFIDIDGRCVDAPYFITNTCNTVNSVENSSQVTLVNASCKTCLHPGLPMSVNDAFICVEDDLVSSYFKKPLVENCLKYSKDGDCLKCDMNSDKKFLMVAKEGNYCSSRCGNDSFSSPYHNIVLQLSGDKKLARVNQINVCISDLNDGCKVYSPSLILASLGSKRCLFCDDDRYVSIVDLSDNSFLIYLDEKNVNPDANTFKLYYNPPLSCVLKSQNSSSAQTIMSDFIEKCRYYIKLPSNSYTCIRCENSYRGIIDSAGLISECIIYSNSSEEKYENVSVDLNKLFSFHKCKTDGQIPFLFVDKSQVSNLLASSIKNIIQFGLFNIDETGAVVSSNNAKIVNIDCLPNTETIYRSPNTTSTYSSLNFKYCAMGFLSMSFNQTISEASYVSYCILCAPGYTASAPSGAGGVSGPITCAKINNCKDVGNIANGCRSCLDNNLFNYTSSGISLRSCNSIPTGLADNYKNCQAASFPSTGIKPCSLCKKGYKLTSSKTCVSIEAKLCKDSILTSNIFSTPSDLYWISYQHDIDFGCRSCVEGYTAIQITSDAYICGKEILSPDVSVPIMDKNSIISNCKIYSFSPTNGLICDECDDGYIINGTSKEILGSACYPKELLPNCLLAFSSDQCAVCLNHNYGLANWTCQKGDIENCRGYVRDINNNIIKCETCQSTFYLSTQYNKCIAGSQYGCDVYYDNDPFSCKKCLDNNMLITGFTSVNMCIPYNSILDCNMGHFFANDSYIELQCDYCKNSVDYINMVLTENERMYPCSPQSLSNCDIIDIDAILNFKTIRCNNCSQNYYRDQNYNCIKHQDVKNCLEYDMYTDACSKCLDGFYLDASTGRCLENPTGITNCETYINYATCQICKPLYYLEDNSCKGILKEIPKCSYYTDARNCLRCESGYILRNNRCLLIVAANCLTNSSERTCNSCPPKYTLQNNLTRIDCILRELPNCEVTSDNDFTSCAKCNKGNALEKGICVEVLKPIDNCLNYFTSTLCEVCDYGFTRSEDKSSCFNNDLIADLIDPNCSTGVEKLIPICTMCANGYYFVDGECVGVCEDQSPEKGCFTCDPEKPEVCIVCLSGYQMNEMGQCLKSKFYNSNRFKSKVFSSSEIAPIIAVFLVYFVLNK